MAVWWMPELGSRDVTDHGRLLGGVAIHNGCMQQQQQDCGCACFTQIDGFAAKRTATPTGIAEPSSALAC
jgi:hypothetical protein